MRDGLFGALPSWNRHTLVFARSFILLSAVAVLHEHTLSTSDTVSTESGGEFNSALRIGRSSGLVAEKTTCRTLPRWAGRIIEEPSITARPAVSNDTCSTILYSNSSRPSCLHRN